MDYKIIEKEAFTVFGVSKNFTMKNSLTEIPKFWGEHYQTGKDAVVCGMYGVCIEGNTGADEFEYLIADDYISTKEVQAGFKTVDIPKHTWAVFSCKGEMPEALQTVNKKIFSEWLPNSKEYELVSGYSIEYYTDSSEYEKGTQDKNYYSEIWIPIQKK